MDVLNIIQNVIDKTGQIQIDLERHYYGIPLWVMMFFPGWVLFRIYLRLTPSRFEREILMPSRNLGWNYLPPSTDLSTYNKEVCGFSGKTPEGMEWYLKVENNSPPAVSGGRGLIPDAIRSLITWSALNVPLSCHECILIKSPGVSSWIEKKGHTVIEKVLNLGIDKVRAKLPEGRNSNDQEMSKTSKRFRWETLWANGSKELDKREFHEPNSLRHGVLPLQLSFTAEPYVFKNPLLRQECEGVASSLKLAESLFSETFETASIHFLKSLFKTERFSEKRFELRIWITPPNLSFEILYEGTGYTLSFYESVVNFGRNLSTEFARVPQEILKYREYDSKNNEIYRYLSSALGNTISE